MQKRKKKIMITWIIIGGIVITFDVLTLVFWGFVVAWPRLFHTDRYKGDHPHLYTVAVNSLLTEGCISIGGIKAYRAAEVTKVDEDDYGRELFIYEGSPVAFGEEYHGARSVLICQKHDEENAYWYDGDNYVLAPYYGYKEEKANGVEDDPYRGVTAEQIEELKENNDWGKEIDDSKLSCAEIVRDPLVLFWSMATRPLDIITKAENFYNDLFEESGYHFSECDNIVRDKDGRAVYCIRGYNGDLDNTSENFRKYIIAIMSPDGEFYEDGWFTYDSPKTYAENLKSIKQSTGWNMKAA